MKNCRVESIQKSFVYKERKSKLILINKDRALSTSIIVDGCEITNDVPKCDYMHLAKDIEFYIELKGKDVKYALKQIESTITILSQDKKNAKKVCYIICTRSPLAATDIQNYKREFRRKFNSNLIVKSSPYEDSY